MEQNLNEDWDFAGADVQYMTHGLHPYPARMIPQIARRLIERYSSSGDVVLDPFCGSGSVLVEATLTGRNSFGIDINPLACLLARVKTTPLNPNLIMNEWLRLRRDIGRDLGLLRFKQLEVKIPDFSKTNISYWFKPYMIEELALIKMHLDEIRDDKLRQFFYVCFSSTVRLVSGTRKGEFKLYRMPENDWKKFRPDVYEVFEKRVNHSISKMGEFFEFVSKNNVKSRTEVFEADTSKLFTQEFPEDARKKLAEESVNLIVTSPPYGDSHTTVAYGQFSRYSLVWLGYDLGRILEIDRRSLGGQQKKKDINSRTLDQTIKRIPNKKRAKEVTSFFVDLNECLQKLYKVLAVNGYACFVLGNRTVNKMEVPTDKILTELGISVGFKPVTIIRRRIPSKRIPWKSSPTNIPGQKVDTISRENIIILKK
ncbi:MAG: DNA methyltransferase [Candidatus Caldarchaeum sp.]